MKLADPGITTEPRELTTSQSRPADIFTTAAVPRRSAALDVCAASPLAAATRGDAAQAAFNHKVTHYRKEIGELRQQNNHCRPLVWTAEERPHPPVTRTLSQVEARNSSRPPPEEGSHGPRSSPEPLREGGHVPALDGGLGCTTLTSTAPTLTQHYQMTMTTSSPSRVFRRNPCRLPVSGGSVFLFAPARCTAPSFSRLRGGVFRSIKGCSWAADGPAATSISRIVLRIRGSQGNSCSTKSPWKSSSGSGVARCSSLSRLISCSAGVRVFVFSVT